MEWGIFEYNEGNGTESKRKNCEIEAGDAELGGDLADDLYAAKGFDGANDRYGSDGADFVGFDAAEFECAKYASDCGV